MDSKVVSSSIKRLIWPGLKQAGFTVFSTRSAWRHLHDRVEVVNFQAVGPKFGAVSGCTPFSFAVNLGCHLAAIPAFGKVKQKDGRSLPEESQCFFRRQLKKTSPQFELSKSKDRNDIWFVDASGANLNPLLEEARSVIERDGLGWFRETASPGWISCDLAGPAACAGRNFWAVGKESFSGSASPDWLRGVGVGEI